MGAGALPLPGGSSSINSLVDLPFALPTAVAGITLTAAYSKNGWFGAPLEAIGIQVAYTPLGVVIALTFVGLPFVVRTVQPVLRGDGSRTRRRPPPCSAPRWQTSAA